MFFRKKVKPKEVVKWGVYSGLLEALFIVLFGVLYVNQDIIFPLGGGWELWAVIWMFFLFALSLIVTFVLVLGHPIYSFTQKRYKEGFLTLAVTFMTLLVLLFLLWQVNWIF